MGFAALAQKTAVAVAGTLHTVTFSLPLTRAGFLLPRFCVGFYGSRAAKQADFARNMIYACCQVVLI